MKILFEQKELILYISSSILSIKSCLSGIPIDSAQILIDFYDKKYLMFFNNYASIIIHSYENGYNKLIISY